MRLFALSCLALSFAALATEAPRAKGMSRVSGGPEHPVRAVVLGVSDFDALKPSEDLPFAEADAAMQAEVLPRVVNVQDMTLLVGAELTYDAMRAAVHEALAGARENEVVLLSFITQGAAVNRKGYLLARDSQPEGRLPYTSLSTDSLQREIAASRAYQVIVLADTAHQPFTAAGARTGPDSPIVPLLGAMGQERSNVLVLAGGAVPGEPGPCGDHGAFTCALVQALEGGADTNRDARVELGELASVLPVALGATQYSLATGVYDASLSLDIAEQPKVSSMRSREAMEVCLQSGGRDVPADHVFHTGDDFSLSLTLTESGYLYLVNQGPDGAVTLLYPMLSESNAVSRGSSVLLPPANTEMPIQFTDPVGPERLVVLFSTRPMGSAVEVMAAAKKSPAARMDEQSWSTVARSKGMTRVVREDDVGARRCSTFTPQGDGDAWVIDMSFDHR